jgi:hypothetical protein
MTNQELEIKNAAYKEDLKICLTTIELYAAQGLPKELFLKLVEQFSDRAKENYTLPF